MKYQRIKDRKYYQSLPPVPYREPEARSLRENEVAARFGVSRMTALPRPHGIGPSWLYQTHRPAKATSSSSGAGFSQGFSTVKPFNSSAPAEIGAQPTTHVLGAENGGTDRRRTTKVGGQNASLSTAYVPWMAKSSSKNSATCAMTSVRPF
jgi:hypothetical protein